MKDKIFSTNIFAHVLFSILLLIMIVIVAINNPNLAQYNEIARIGGIEIGTDSVIAVNLLKKRMNEINAGTELEYGDSVGYTYPPANESFYVKFDKGVVNDIYFTSKILKEKDVSMYQDNKLINNKKSFIHKGKKIVFEFDGENCYHVYLLK